MVIKIDRQELKDYMAKVCRDCQSDNRPECRLQCGEMSNALNSLMFAKSLLPRLPKPKDANDISVYENAI